MNPGKSEKKKGVFIIIIIIIIIIISIIIIIIIIIITQILTPKPKESAGLKDFKEISVDIGATIRESPSDAARNIVEDIHNVKLVTHSKDEIYMRCVL
jgi:flagellar basal body-associated protein FliL